MWSDSGRLRSMFRLRQVVATTADRDSRFGDDNEERNAAFFQRSLLVDSEPEYREQTYLVADPEFPFGFEYISRCKPIAIFTDGWEYHRDRLEKDIQQRLAIVRTNNYWCWSITWDDVEAQIDPDRIRKGESRDGLNCALNPGFKANAETFYQQYQCLDLRPLESLSSFDWLMAYLAHPEASQWGNWALMRTAAQANPKQDSPDWQQQIADYLGSQAILQWRGCANESWSSESKYIANEIEVSTLLKVWIGVDIQRHRQLDLSASLVTLILADENFDPDGEIVHTNWVEMLRLPICINFSPISTG